MLINTSSLFPPHSQQCHEDVDDGTTGAAASGGVPDTAPAASAARKPLKSLTAFAKIVRRISSKTKKGKSQGRQGDGKRQEWEEPSKEEFGGFNVRKLSCRRTFV